MPEAKKTTNCKVCFCMVLVSTLFLIVLGAHIWMTVQKVLTGHGLEVFYFKFTIPRYGMTYISALIYYIIFAISLLFLPIIYWFSTKEERTFKKKYHIDE